MTKVHVKLFERKEEEGGYWARIHLKFILDDWFSYGDSEMDGNAFVSCLICGRIGNSFDTFEFFSILKA